MRLKYLIGINSIWNKRKRNERDENGEAWKHLVEEKE